MAGTVKEARLGFKEMCLRYFSYVMVHLVHRPKLYGSKPMPHGPTIYACRHVGLIDPVILMVEYFPWMIRPLVAKDYYDKNRFTQSFYRTAQCIPLDRKHASTRWVEESLAALGKGESVIIYPEGRRNKSGVGLLKFQNGVAMLAAKSGAQVVPVWNAFWKFPHRYRLAVGEPVLLDPLPAEGVTTDWLEAQTQKIQDAVALLEKRFD